MIREETTTIKMGVADHCKEYYYDVVLNGKIVERRGFACLMKGKIMKVPLVYYC